MSSPPVIQIEHLFKEYHTDAGAVPVLKGVNLSVMPGEFVAIMGPSGSSMCQRKNTNGLISAKQCVKSCHYLDAV